MISHFFIKITTKPSLLHLPQNSFSSPWYDEDNQHTVNSHGSGSILTLSYLVFIVTLLNNTPLSTYFTDATPGAQRIQSNK